MQFTIYHTNDIHSNYDVLKKIHSYIKKNKKENDLYFDSGDFTDLKNIIVQADKGISAMEMFMECGLDGITLGNNEVDLTYDAISELVKHDIPYITSNVTDNEDNAITGVPSSRIYERAGKRILVIGVSPYYKEGMVPSGYNVFSMMGNLKFHDPIESIRLELEKMKDRYDYCILLSHSGTDIEKNLMDRFPEIDLCLGGHYHEVVNYHGYSQSATGNDNSMGIITLDIDGDHIIEIENRQIVLPDADDAEFDALLNSKKELAQTILSKELEICEELHFDNFEENELINFVCDALRKRFGGDLAIMHHGIAESSLHKPVSKLKLIEIFPSKLNPTTMPVLGRNIAQAVKLSMDKEYIKDEGKGPGFRGHVLGALGFSSNVNINSDTFEIFINGVPLDEDKIYTVITDDYLQRGTGYPSLKVSDEEVSFDIWFIRDLVEYYLTDKELFALAKIRRIIH